VTIDLNGNRGRLQLYVERRTHFPELEFTRSILDFLPLSSEKFSSIEQAVSSVESSERELLKSLDPMLWRPAGSETKVETIISEPYQLLGEIISGITLKLESDGLRADTFGGRVIEIIELTLNGSSTVKWSVAKPLTKI